MEGSLVPYPLVAVTMKTYAVPGMSPVRLAEVAVAPATVIPVQAAHGGMETMLYLVTADWGSPGLLFGGSVQVTVAVPPMEAVAVALVGAFGTVDVGYPGSPPTAAEQYPDSGVDETPTPA